MKDEGRHINVPPLSIIKLMCIFQRHSPLAVSQLARSITRSSVVASAALSLSSKNFLYNQPFYWKTITWLHTLFIFLRQKGPQETPADLLRITPYLLSVPCLGRHSRAMAAAMPLMVPWVVLMQRS